MALVTLLPDVGVYQAFGFVILAGCLSVALHDFVERGFRRRAERLRGMR